MTPDAKHLWLVSEGAIVVQGGPGGVFAPTFPLPARSGGRGLSVRLGGRGLNIGAPVMELLVWGLGLCCRLLGPNRTALRPRSLVPN